MAYTTIKKPSDYFNTVLYTGDDSSNRGITGVGFQPDLVWNKTRNQSNFNHYIFDSVRGAGEIISSNLTNAETDYTSEFLSLDSDGFSVTQDAGSLGINWSSGTYVNWCWLGANGTASNTDGDITSTVSANTTSGFSIVSYTGNGTGGATVGHGLGIKPKIVFYKRRDTTSDWTCLQDIEGSLKYSYLNTNAAFASAGETPPTSSLLYLSSGSDTNASGGTFVAYCFADVKGFSKFGSYTGNASLDGSFIYTGFKPAWVVIKRTDVINSWVMFDNKRDGTYGLSGNPRARHLYTNTNDPEDSADNYNKVDFLSNGFKLREDNTTINADGGSYIYMAFAEEPLVGDNPATAR